MKKTRILGFFLLCVGIVFLELVKESGWRFIAGTVVGFSLTMMIWPKSLPWNKGSKEK